MTISAFDFSRLEKSHFNERRERPRFALACPVRLLRAGVWIGESRTRDISCESFSCVLPDPYLEIVPGEVLECEIDLPVAGRQTTHAQSVQLQCQAAVLDVRQHEYGSEVICRLLGYNIETNRR